MTCAVILKEFASPFDCSMAAALGARSPGLAAISDILEKNSDICDARSPSAGKRKSSSRSSEATK